MSGIGTFAIVARAPAQTLRAASARVEKACESNTLHNDARHEDFAAAGSARAHANSALQQNETQSCAPLWHGPRLRAAFVAQVLGQVMPEDNKTARSPAAAYQKPVAQGKPVRGFNTLV